MQVFDKTVDQFSKLRIHDRHHACEEIYNSNIFKEENTFKLKPHQFFVVSVIGEAFSCIFLHFVEK